MKLINLINFLINNPCEEPEILKIIYFIKLILKVAFIVVPIVLIILITADFIKSVTAGNEDTMKKNQKLVVKRIIYCLMIFFVLPIVNIVFSAFGTSGQEDLIEAEGASYLSCWDNAKDMETINGFEIVANFDPKGGKVYGDSTKSCGGSSYCEISSLPNAAKKGYIFEGWSNNGCYTQTKVGKMMLNKADDNNFIACWKEKPKEELPEEGYIPESGKGKSDSQKAAADINNSNASSFWWPIGAGSDGKPVSTSITSGRGFKSSHLGLDINQGGKSNVPIIASYDGIVYQTGNDCRNTYGKEYIYGVYVVLQHNYNGKTIYTNYGHMVCDSIPSNIVKGAKVTAGTKLGIMGNTGNSSGTHLHYEVREGSWSPRSSVSVDPLKYIKSSNPYPEKEGSNGDTGGSGSNNGSGSKQCNGKTVNIVNKDGVTYINDVIVVNKTYSLPSSYNPSGLTNQTQLASSAKTAFDKMAKAIKEAGQGTIKIYSGFRSYSTQQSTYKKWVNTKGSQAAADEISARAGHSEHQTGLAVDINNVKTSFKNTTEGKWLSKNAYKYGFILRYPDGKKPYTGYNFEPWHYRYVGTELAKELYNGGNWITMEEYFCIDSEYK